MHTRNQVTLAKKRERGSAQVITGEIGVLTATPHNENLAGPLAAIEQ